MSDIAVHDWILDSGAFSRLTPHKRAGVNYAPKGHMPVEEYVQHIERWSRCGNLLAAVAQDYMCESFVLCSCKHMGFSDGTVEHHQRLTIERYDALMALSPSVPIMPVLQGFEPSEYVQHLHDYGDRLAHGAWVGVGSVCKRNYDSQEVARILIPIKAERPDLRLHGFGLKNKALSNATVSELLYSSDSQAASFGARMARANGDTAQSANDPVMALAYANAIDAIDPQNTPVQMMLVLKNDNEPV